MEAEKSFFLIVPGGAKVLRGRVGRLIMRKKKNNYTNIVPFKYLRVPNIGGEKTKSLFPTRLYVHSCTLVHVSADPPVETFGLVAFERDARIARVRLECSHDECRRRAAK